MERREFLGLAAASVTGMTTTGCLSRAESSSFTFESWVGRRWLRYKSRKSGEYAREYPTNDWWMLVEWSVTAGEEPIPLIEAADVAVFTDELVHLPTEIGKQVIPRDGNDDWNAAPPSVDDDSISPGDTKRYVAVFDTAADFDPELDWLGNDIERQPEESSPPPYDSTESR